MAIIQSDTVGVGEQSSNAVHHSIMLVLTVEFQDKKKSKEHEKGVWCVIVGQRRFERVSSWTELILLASHFFCGFRPIVG